MCDKCRKAEIALKKAGNAFYKAWVVLDEARDACKDKGG
jgi:hypothetical protein